MSERIDRASINGSCVDQHFSAASYWQIYELGEEAIFIETRKPRLSGRNHRRNPRAGASGRPDAREIEANTMPKTLEEFSAPSPLCAGRKEQQGTRALADRPGCNLLCSFCQRDGNENYDANHRPGVSGRVISPDEEVEVLRNAILLCPGITEEGIAGPGDTLAPPTPWRPWRT